MYHVPKIPEKDFDNSLTYALFRRDMGTVWNVGKNEKNFNSAMDPAAYERNIEKIRRAQLKSTDGNTAEIYDQFYRDHKLLLVLFRALAVMPIQRSSPGRITFSWKSSATIYAILFWSVMTIVVFIVGRERINILQTTKFFDDYIYSIIFVVFLVPHFWIPFVGWGVANEVSKYKTMWGAFQIFSCDWLYTGVPSPEGVDCDYIHRMSLVCCFVFAITQCSIGWISTVAHLGLLSHYHDDQHELRSMVYKLQSYKGCIKRLINQIFKSNDVQVECTAALISQYRFLWLNLSELLQSLGNAYTRTYSTYCLFMFVNITIAVYGAFSEIFEYGFQLSFKELGLLVDAIYCSLLLYIFCDCSHQATLRVAQGVQDTLLSVNLKKVDKPTQREIDLFIVAIEMNPAIVSLKGYANVNRELLTASVTTIAIYLIVLLQFKMSLSRVANVH